jgi:VanZ family protein
LLGLVGYIAGLFVGGAQPVAVGLFPSPWDKLAHVTAFGAMAVLLELALRPAQWLLVVFPSAVSVLDELHQIFLPGRHASGADWLAATAGAVLALLVLRFTTVRRLVSRLYPDGAVES